MIRRRSFIAWPAVFFTGLACFLIVASRARAGESFRIEGAVANPRELTAPTVKEQFASDLHQVEYTSHGDKHRATCVSLLSLLKASGVPTDFKMDPKAEAKIKNLPLRFVVIVEASDGYVGAFSLAELLPTVGNREAWVAIDVDGKPLTEPDGPARLIVPGDQKPSRWVHGIASIRVINAAAKEPTTRKGG